MFMAHLDTVHGKEGKQSIFIGTDNLIDTDGADVLGADDGAGIGLITDLMISGVPALYLFSQKEETGGDGGRYAVKTPHWSGVERLISFDRKGNTDICGEQYCGTLASVEFVNALASKLGMDHEWARGSYTDNSEFQGFVPEIVNVSIGYMDNHTSSETLDFTYYHELRCSCLAIDWDSLPVIGPDTSNDYNGISTGYYDGISTWDTGDTPQDEFMDLCDETGIDPNSWESQMILDALHRCYKAGQAESKSTKYVKNFRESQCQRTSNSSLCSKVLSGPGGRKTQTTSPGPLAQSR
jgi:hypothetical protein